MSKNKHFVSNKPAAPKKTLKQKLHEIYCNTINLDTTCKGICECCKTACPQMNFSEFSQLINEIWETTNREEKIELICTSVEYFFRNEFEKWGKESLIKKCMLLTNDGKCRWYSSRPLSCRMYGLWPKKVYNARVDKFEQAYKGLLKRKELPLNTQCPHVKRIDETTPLTEEVINGLYRQLDDLDKQIEDYTDLQITNKENYRAFHDWLLLKIFGETWLVTLTNFMLGAEKEAILDQIRAIKDALRNKFSKDMPNLRLVK